MRTIRYILVFYIAAILLTACSPGGPQSAELDGTTWILTAYNKNAPLPGTAPTIEFEGDTVSGNASCNSFGGSVRMDGGSITFEALYNTEMFCMDPEGVMDQETAYLQLLSQAERFQIDGDTLTIIAGPQKTLTFVRQ